MYRIQAVRQSSASFTNRVNICKAYCGQRTEELNKLVGRDDCEFVHAAGFIGGAWSLETCIKIAEDSLKEHAGKNNTPEVDLQKK